MRKPARVATPANLRPALLAIWQAWRRSRWRMRRNHACGGEAPGGVSARDPNAKPVAEVVRAEARIKVAGVEWKSGNNPKWYLWAAYRKTGGGKRPEWNGAD